MMYRNISNLQRISMTHLTLLSILSHLRDWRAFRQHAFFKFTKGLHSISFINPGRRTVFQAQKTTTWMFVNNVIIAAKLRYP